ncbi:MAG: recombinase zinc beta ribbon domain-containing protein, partial [Faecalibacterium prausnitzii]
EKGIKNKRGGPMTFNVIQHMLSNRRYIGELKYRDVLIPDAIPPIVSAELFNDVQEKMLKNKKAPARRKAEDDYLLTTKLFCGYCGALMFGESGTSRTGEVHRYYKCATAKKHKGCKKKTVRKQWLEDLVVNQTMQLVKDDAAMESIIAKVMELQNKENTNIPLYEKQLRDAESGIQNMLNAIQAGILTSSTKERLEQLEETKRELEARIAEEKLAKPKVTEEFIRFWLLRFRKLDMSLKDQRQALVDTFINAIYLYDDKVLITFNYKEGTQTVTFGEASEIASEVNGSDLDCFTAPDIERQIVRFGVLSLCRKAAAHFLHTVCTFARIGGFSAQGLSLWMTTPNCWHCCVSSCAAQATPNDVPRNTNCYKTARPPAARRPCRFVLYFAKSGNFPRPHSATLTGRTYTPSAA